MWVGGGAYNLLQIPDLLFCLQETDGLTCTHHLCVKKLFPVPHPFLLNSLCSINKKFS